MISPVCWQCDKLKKYHEGKISKSGIVFTCFDCLTKWHDKQRPIWKQETIDLLKSIREKPIVQMDFFELHESLNLCEKS